MRGVVACDRRNSKSALNVMRDWTGATVLVRSILRGRRLEIGAIAGIGKVPGHSDLVPGGAGISARSGVCSGKIRKLEYAATTVCGPVPRLNLAQLRRSSTREGSQVAQKLIHALDAAQTLN